MSKYTSRQGDTVAYICHKYYRTTKGGTVEKVLEVNPQLSNYPPVLPAGIAIELPELPKPATEKQLITLWE